MAGLLDYLNPFQKLAPPARSNNPIRGLLDAQDKYSLRGPSVMRQADSPEWIRANQLPNQRIGGDALEAPMISPDDLIGTGIPTHLASLGAMGAKALLAKSGSAGLLGAVGHMVDHRELYRGLQQPYDNAVKKSVEWFSETPQLANEYGSHIVTKLGASGVDVADLGLRDYMTEVKQDNVLDRVKRAVIDNFNKGRIDKNKAIELNDKIEDMRTGGNEYKRAHEWVNTDDVSSILSDAGYGAISHVENGNQTYGFLHR